MVYEALFYWSIPELRLDVLRNGIEPDPYTLLSITPSRAWDLTGGGSVRFPHREITTWDLFQISLDERDMFQVSEIRRDRSRPVSVYAHIHPSKIWHVATRTEDL